MVRELAGFFDFEHFAAFIVATLRASAVWHLAFVAIRALGKRVAGQPIVRPPRAGAPLGVAAFGIRHGNPFENQLLAISR
jgi:hypothetical protein